MEARSRPDSVALREALRGFRYILRRAKASLQDMPVPALPGPAGEIAAKAAREVNVLTAEIDAAASSIARKFLGSERVDSLRLEKNIHSGDFAMAIYWALQVFLDRFDISDQLVSEVAAQDAYILWREHASAPDDLIASDLTLQLLDLRVIRGAPLQGTQNLPTESIRPVAVFSAVLWLLSATSDGEEEQTLLAAQDVAVALKADITRACNERDREQLGRLYHDFATHV